MAAICVPTFPAGWGPWACTVCTSAHWPRAAIPASNSCSLPFRTKAMSGAKGLVSRMLTKMPLGLWSGSAMVPKGRSLIIHHTGASGVKPGLSAFADLTALSASTTTSISLRFSPRTMADTLPLTGEGRVSLGSRLSSTSGCPANTSSPSPTSRRGVKPTTSGGFTAKRSSLLMSTTNLSASPPRGMSSPFFIVIV